MIYKSVKKNRDQSVLEAEDGRRAVEGLVNENETPTVNN